MVCKSSKKIEFTKPKESNSYYQSNPKSFDALVELINAHPFSYSKILNAKGRRRDPDIIPRFKYLNDWVNEVTSYKLSDPFYSTPTKCYWIVYDLHEFPKCVACGKSDWYEKHNVHFWNGYSRTCSKKCRQDDPLTKQHRINTCQKKYGVDNPWQSKEIKDKIFQTRLEKYGNGNYRNSEKTNETKKKHAEENPQYLLSIDKKRRETCLKRFGYENSAQCPEIISKMHKKYEFDGLKFDSSIEIAYFIWAKDHGIQIEKPNISFKYEFNGKFFHYIPDFFLPDTNQYIEIKGDQFFKSNDGKMMIPWRHKNWTDEQYAMRCEKEEAKHQCMVVNNVKIILESEMKEMKSYVKNTYGKNYLKQFKCK